VIAPPSYKDNPIKAIHYGFLFNVYVLMQLFNLVNARKLLAHEWNPFANFFNNKYFLMILIIAIVVQIGLVNVPLLAEVLKIKSPSLPMQAVSIGLGATSILWGKKLLH
jgi:Ca2+ transporting ATPase